MTMMTDLFLNLVYPQLQQEPIRTLSAVQIHPRVETVVIDNHSIRDIGLLANYRHITSISLMRLRLDTSLAELLAFVGDAERFPALREVAIDSVVFDARRSGKASPQLAHSVPSSIGVSLARKRRSGITKLSVVGVYLPGRAPMQAFIDMAAQSLNSLTLSELTLELQSDRDTDAEYSEETNFMGLLIPFPNLQLYNSIVVSDQLKSLSRTKVAELLVAMRSRLRDAKDMLEDTTQKLTKQTATVKALREALDEARAANKALEEKALSLSVTCSTLQTENTRLSQNNDILDYLGISAPPSGELSASAGNPTPTRLQLPRTEARGVQVSQSCLISCIDRAVATDALDHSMFPYEGPQRKPVVLPDMSPVTYTLSGREESSKSCSVSNVLTRESRNYTLLSEGSALSQMELYCNRVGMLIEDLYSQFNQKIQQKNNEIAILVDALVQVRSETLSDEPHDTVELATAKKTIVLLNGELEQLREQIGTTQEELQNTILEKEQLAADKAQLQLKLEKHRRQYEVDMAATRDLTLAEMETETRSKLMESNAHIRLLEDKIVTLEDQIKLQEVELAVAEETHCAKCVSAALTRFGVFRSSLSVSHSDTCAATQTDVRGGSVTVGCQHSGLLLEPPAEPALTLAIESLYSFGFIGAARQSNPKQVTTSCQTEKEATPLSSVMASGNLITTAVHIVQTDNQPEVGPEDLVADVLKSNQLEEALSSATHEYNILRKQHAAQESKLKQLIGENRRLHDHNRKLLKDCKDMTAELAHQRLKESTPATSSTLEPNEHEVERTKLLLDLNKALQQRDTYRHNLKRAISYVAKLMDASKHTRLLKPSSPRKQGSSPTRHRDRDRDDAVRHNDDPYKQRITRLQSQVQHLAHLKAQHTRVAQDTIGKEDMLRQHNLYPRRGSPKSAVVCTPAMSQELIDSLEELARRIDAMLPERQERPSL